jgi:hypothetical protein
MFLNGIFGALDSRKSNARKMARATRSSSCVTNCVSATTLLEMVVKNVVRGVWAEVTHEHRFHCRVNVIAKSLALKIFDIVEHRVGSKVCSVEIFFEYFWIFILKINRSFRIIT